MVGAGPANLAAAIHLQRLINHHNQSAPAPIEASIALVEKGRHPGAHLLSGALLDTRALKELLPDYLERGCPLGPEVEAEELWYLTRNRKLPLPFIPDAFSNRGLRTCSLSRLGAWLWQQAEAEGVECFDSTAAVAPVIEEGRLAGVLTDDKGLDREGAPKASHEPGIILEAKAFLVGEGAAGSLTRDLAQHFRLRQGAAPQRYETGVKESWRIPAGRIAPGTAHHAFGHPLPTSRYGGGWLYALSETELSLGFVTAVEPDAPVADPQLNLQRFKSHPLVAPLLRGGTLLEAGARTITSGGFDAMGRLWGPGFLLTGESAGMLDMQRLKGIHLAMKSGMLAAETLFEALCEGDFSTERLRGYEERFMDSWVYAELFAARNYRKAFDRGLFHGLFQAGISLKLPGAALLEKEPKQRPAGPAAASRDLKALAKALNDLQPDGKLSFSKSDALFRSGTQHEEEQPCHLRITEESMATLCNDRCRREYGNPCQYFCPAGVYECIASGEEGTPVLRLNPSNCLHCKTCEVADPYGAITWTPPEGGGGPGYKLG